MMARASSKLAWSTHPTLHLGHPMLGSFIWNTLIRASALAAGSFCPSLAIYTRMRRHAVAPDFHTFPFLLHPSNGKKQLSAGQQVHAQSLLFGFCGDSFVQSSLIGMYSSSGGLCLASRVFEEIDWPDIPSWNLMLNSYVKAGSIGFAKKMFDEMPERNVITWSSMINAYVKFGLHRAALSLFREMRLLKQRPNEFTLSAALSASAHLGDLGQGKLIHLYIEKLNMKIDSVLGTALVDMYVKCGNIDDAKKIFCGLGMKKDTKAYSAMISGLAMHGHAEESLKLFENLIRTGVKPNAVTLLGVLCACVHGGFINEGRNYFKIMESQFGVAPSVQHYGCMVDLYGRAGLIEEARHFISCMPMKPDAVIMGALLSGSRTHKNTETCELALKKLIKLDPRNSSAYLLLSNAYAKLGQWKEARRVRDEMETKGVKKVPGTSAVEIEGQRHVFFSGDETHPANGEIYKMLEIMKAVGSHGVKDELAS